MKNTKKRMTDVIMLKYELGDNAINIIPTPWSESDIDSDEVAVLNWTWSILCRPEELKEAYDKLREKVMQDINQLAARIAHDKDLAGYAFDTLNDVADGYIKGEQK